jgi:anti-sigma factor RsiW
MDCREQIALIHLFLDGEIDEAEHRLLQDHLSQCGNCRQVLYEHQKSIALVQSLSHVHAPEGFTERVMAYIPASSRNTRFSNWLRNHPFLTAAAVFFVLMTSSLMASWFDRDETLHVSSPNMDKLLIDQKRNTVIVPEGITVHGDLIVRNGNVQVNGEVRGNVVAIEGTVFKASTAQIAGNAESIEQIVDYIWYQLKNLGNDLLPTSP